MCSETVGGSAAEFVDQQAAIGYFYPLSKRTTVYVDLVHEGRDNLPADRKSVGWDLGIKHNF